MSKQQLLHDKRFLIKNSQTMILECTCKEFDREYGYRVGRIHWLCPIHNVVDSATRRLIKSYCVEYYRIMLSMLARIESEWHNPSDIFTEAEIEEIMTKGVCRDWELDWSFLKITGSKGVVPRQVVFDTAMQIWLKQQWGDSLVLADMLEENGCHERRILEHLRQTTVKHSPLCWVLVGVIIRWNTK